MEDYNIKLKQLGADTLNMHFPETCHRLDSMFQGGHFSMARVADVKALVTDSCRKLVIKKSQTSLATVKKSAEDLAKATAACSVSSGTRSKRKLQEDLASGCLGGRVRTSDLTDGQLADLVCEELARRGFAMSQSSSGGTEVIQQSRPKLRKILKARRTKQTDLATAESEDDDSASSLMKSNPYIVTMMELLKPEVGRVIEMCNTLTAWVQLHVPKIEDGNNFGVEVQSEILEGIKAVEMESTLIQKTLSLYYMSRAEIAYELSKLPEVQDFAKALEELDTKQFMTLRMLARDQRNSCYGLLDMMRKNIDKVLKPKSASHSHFIY